MSPESIKIVTDCVMGAALMVAVAFYLYCISK